MAKSDKTAQLPRASDYTKAFLKDWERLSRTGRYNMAQLKEAMIILIANDAPLGPQWKDHALKGDWQGTRECHIGGDFLMIYELSDEASASGKVVFVRIGTHSELFK
jgi:mRNA interferase YafQ